MSSKRHFFLRQLQEFECVDFTQAFMLTLRIQAPP